jgi:hypothetical protein
VAVLDGVAGLGARAIAAIGAFASRWEPVERRWSLTDGFVLRGTVLRRLP